jgi:hypothetical protein
LIAPARRLESGVARTIGQRKPRFLRARPMVESAGRKPFYDGALRLRGFERPLIRSLKKNIDLHFKDKLVRSKGSVRRKAAWGVGWEGARTDYSGKRKERG